jgi:hypothetical protein
MSTSTNPNLVPNCGVIHELAFDLNDAMSHQASQLQLSLRGLDMAARIADTRERAARLMAQPFEGDDAPLNGVVEAIDRTQAAGAKIAGTLYGNMLDAANGMDGLIGIYTGDIDMHTRAHALTGDCLPRGEDRRRVERYERVRRVQRGLGSLVVRGRFDTESE